MGYYEEMAKQMKQEQKERLKKKWGSFYKEWCEVKNKLDIIKNEHKIEMMKYEVEKTELEVELLKQGKKFWTAGDIIMERRKEKAKKKK